MSSPNDVLEYGKEAISKIDKEMERLSVAWTEASAQRQAWAVILNVLEPQPQPTNIAEWVSDPATDASKRDKGEVVEETIRKTGEAGFIPREITDKVESMGAALPTGFVSNRVFRMKKKGELVEHNKRYYLPRFDPKPRLQLSPANEKEVTEATP